MPPKKMPELTDEFYEKIRGIIREEIDASLDNRFAIFKKDVNDRLDRFETNNTQVTDTLRTSIDTLKTNTLPAMAKHYDDILMKLTKSAKSLK